MKYFSGDFSGPVKVTYFSLRTKKKSTGKILRTGYWNLSMLLGLMSSGDFWGDSGVLCFYNYTFAQLSFYINYLFVCHFTFVCNVVNLIKCIVCE